MYLAYVDEVSLKCKFTKGVFVGYMGKMKGFKAQSLSKKQVIVSRNADFDEVSIIHIKTKEAIRGVCKKLKKKDLVIY